MKITVSLFVSGAVVSEQVHEASTLLGLQFLLSYDMQAFLANVKGEIIPVPQWMWDHFQEHGQFDWPLACSGHHILMAHAEPAPTLPRCDEVTE